MKTNNFIFFEKYFELGEEMSNEQFGRVIKAIGKMLITGDESLAEEFDSIEKMLYSVMRFEIAQGHKKYEAACQNNNKYKNNNYNNYNNKTQGNYDFDEIERLELQRRLKEYKDIL